MKFFTHCTLLGGLCALTPLQGMKYSKHLKKLRYAPVYAGIEILSQRPYSSLPKYSAPQGSPPLIPKITPQPTREATPQLMRKGYKTDHKGPGKYAGSFGLQYLKNVENENRNEENEQESDSWFDRTWQKIKRLFNKKTGVAVGVIGVGLAGAGLAENKPIDFMGKWGFTKKELKAIGYFKPDKNFDGPSIELRAAGAYMAYSRLGAPWNARMNRHSISNLGNKLHACYRKEYPNAAGLCRAGMEEWDEMVGMAKGRQGHNHPDIAASLESVREHLLEHNIHGFTQSDIEQERVERKAYEEKCQKRDREFFEKQKK